MILHEEGDIKWFGSIEDVKPEYYPIKVWSILQFYTLKGRTSTLSASNIEVIRYLQYLVYSPSDKRFYMRFFRAYDLDTLYFHRRSLTFSGEDEAVSNLRRYVDDNNVWLLFTRQQITDTTALLQRLWKANLNGDGKLDYKIYLELLQQSLDLEDYRDLCKNCTGYRTVINQYETRIRELWLKASNDR